MPPMLETGLGAAKGDNSSGGVGVASGGFPQAWVGTGTLLMSDAALPPKLGTGLELVKVKGAHSGGGLVAV